ncbi:hypothetical protein BH09ACT7_BH09ACT7_57430 [soil metagenome]
MSGGVGLSVAAVALAVALLIAPVSPRRRLIPPGRRKPGRPLIVGAGVCAAAAAFSVPATTSLAAALAVGTLVLRHRRHAAKRRAADEGRALQGALEVLVGELRIGAHPVRAFDIAADEAGGTVGAAFRSVAARAGLGANVAAGLRAVAVRSTLTHEWDRLAVFWQLAAQHGLAVATLMRAAQLDIVERQRFHSRLEAIPFS